MSKFIVLITAFSLTLKEIPLPNLQFSKLENVLNTDDCMANKDWLCVEYFFKTLSLKNCIFLVRSCKIVFEFCFLNVKNNLFSTLPFYFVIFLGTYLDVTSTNHHHFGIKRLEEGPYLFMLSKLCSNQVWINSTILKKKHPEKDSLFPQKTSLVFFLNLLWFLSENLNENL